MSFMFFGGVGAIVAVAAVGDKVSRILARPGVAAAGIPGRAGPREAPAVAPAGPSAGERKLIVVFGATGGTGLAVVEVALEKGYHVRAFVRNRQRLQRELRDLSLHNHLEIVEGNLEDLPAVKASVEEAFAVISVAGARPESAPPPMANAMPAIVAGCRQAGVRRLIVQACTLSGAPGERWALLTHGRLARAVVRWQNGSTVVDDNERVMEFLYNQVRDLDWVVTRPSSMEDGDRLGPLAPSFDEPSRPGALRYLDVADWTLAQVETDAYVGKMPRLLYAFS